MNQLQRKSPMPKLRQRKCRNPECRTWFEPRSSFAKACSPACAIRVVWAEQAKQARKEHQQAKQRLKTRSDWLKDAQTAFNAYIRARDRHKGCVSCSDPLTDNAYGGKVDCSHYRSIGAAPHLRYNVFNAAAACVKCNRWLSGNAVEFRIRLIERIGLERVERLESDQSVKQFDIDYLKRVKRVFNRRARLVEKRHKARELEREQSNGQI